MRNVGWILTSFFTGTLWTNQVLLNIVIPLWLVEATDAPHVLLAWLFGTNTVLCIFLPAYTSKGVRNLRDAMRYTWISSAFFVVSCLITMVTHSTVGLVTVLLVWLGHVTVTGAELAISGASWSFQAELMDPARRGEYQGVQEVSRALGGQWAPWLYTGLALSWIGGPRVAGDRGHHRGRDDRARPVGADGTGIPRHPLPGARGGRRRGRRRHRCRPGAGTGVAELFQSAGEWGLQAELSDPERRGEYQGVSQLGSTLGSVWAPALYTFLAMSWGPPGWLVSPRSCSSRPS